MFISESSLNCRSKLTWENNDTKYNQQPIVQQWKQHTKSLWLLLIRC